MEPEPESARLEELSLQDSSRAGHSPFSKPGLLARVGPFALVAVVAEASLALPPGIRVGHRGHLQPGPPGGGGAGVPASMGPASRLDARACPSGLHWMGAGSHPGRRHRLGRGPGRADPAYLDRPVPPPVGVDMCRGRDRGSRDRHVGRPVSAGRGHGPPCAAVGGARWLARGGHARPPGPNPPVSAVDRAVAGTAPRAHRRRGPGSPGRRSPEQCRPADLRCRAEAARCPVPVGRGRGAAAGGVVRGRSRRRHPPAQAGDLRL